MKFNKKKIRRHTGDTGMEQDNEHYESRHATGHRYSLSDMITQIKRSIPDLRSIKHQPLENRESPPSSPRQQRYNIEPQQTHSSDHHHHHHHGKLETMGRTSFDKETDAITLSAIQTTSCTCGSKNTTTDIPVTVDKASVSGTSDDLEGFTVPHSSSHHIKSAPNELR